MTSRIPPSRRDPRFAPQRAVKALSDLVPGAGRVPGVARPGVSAAVAAALRGRAVEPSAGSGGWTPEVIIRYGTAVIASNVLPPGIRVPAAYTLTDAYIRVGTAPTGSSLTVLVKRAGSTIATLTVAASATSGSDTGLSVALAAGDVLTFDITAVGSTMPGSNVAVELIAA